MQKNCYARFTTLALKTLSELDMHAFVPLNCLFLFVVHFLLIRNNGEIHRKKTLFELEKQRYLPHF